jgi:hypothetical protein
MKAKKEDYVVTCKLKRGEITFRCLDMKDAYVAYWAALDNKVDARSRSIRVGNVQRSEWGYAVMAGVDSMIGALGHIDNDTDLYKLTNRRK